MALTGGFDLGTAYAKVLIDESGVESGISSIKDKFEGLSSGLTTLGSNMTLLGAPFLAFGAMAVKSFSDSQDQLAQLDAVLKSTTAHNGEWSTSTAMSAEDLQKLSDKLDDANKKLSDMETVYSSNTKHTTAQTLALQNQRDEVKALTAQIAAGNATTTTQINVTHLSRQALIDLSKGFQEVTKFSDETVLSAENMLLTFTNVGKNVFPDATKTVLDMSQALGQDTKSSAIQLGKALNDPIKGITALQRVGVAFTESQKAMITQLVNAGKVEEAQKIILKELQTEFGGSAEAAGKTFSGQLEILKNRFDDLLETIGEKLLPIAEQFLDWIGNAITWFERLDPGLQNVIIGFIALMGALAVIGPVIAVIGAGLGALGAVFAVVFSPIGVIIAAVIGAILLLKKAFEDNFLGIRDFLQPIIDGIGDFFMHFSDRVKLYGSLFQLYFDYYITSNLKKIWDVVAPALGKLLAWFVSDGLPWIQNALLFLWNNVLSPVVDFIKGIWEKVKGELGKFADWFTTGGLQEIVKGLLAFKTNAVDPFIKAVNYIWDQAKPGLELLKLGFKAAFDWINTNVLQPVVNFIQSIIDKINELMGVTQRLKEGGSGGGSRGFDVGYTPTSPTNNNPYVTSSGGFGGVQPIPPAHPGGASPIPQQGNGLTVHIGNITASTREGGAAAAQGFQEKLEDMYRGRGN